MTNEEQKLREIVERWMGKKHPITMQSYVSDLTVLISEHCVSMEKYKELLQQRNELKDSLVDMVNQFAYRGTYEGRESLHTGGLSALESAFGALGLSDPIALLDFEAAIKNTER